MRLAVKLVLVVFAGTVVVLVVDGWYSIRRESRSLHTDMRQQMLLVGHALAPLVADVWRVGGRRRVLEILADVNRGEREILVRWVWLDGGAKAPSRPAVPASRLTNLSTGKQVFSEQTGDEGASCLYLYIPVSVPEDRPGAIELSMSLKRMEQRMWSTIRKTGMLTLIIGSFSGMAALGMGFLMVGKPLDRLTEKVRRIGAGDLTGPVSLAGHDELGELAEGLNEMCVLLRDARARTQRETEARIRALEQLRHQDRLTTLGRLASGLAHELGTPLNVVSGRATMVTRGNLSPEMVTECASIVRDQCRRMTKIIQQLLDYARIRPPQRTVTDMLQLSREVRGFLSQLAQSHDVEIEVGGNDESCSVEVDPAQMQQVFTNLLMNAVQAMPDGGKVTVTVGRARAAHPDKQDRPEAEYVLVRVTDRGTGIAEEDLKHIFEPFFTTKDVGRGTGLGLSIASGIVQEHGGWIDAKSEVGGGSCFSVYLPLEETKCLDES